MKHVVLGLLGVTLDGGKGPTRWEAWRPSVALCQHEDILVHRFELLHQKSHASLAETVCEDIAAVSPETEVRVHEIDLRDAWDFEEVYGILQDFARRLLQTAPPPRKRTGPGTYRIIDLDLSRYDAIARRFAREHHEGLSFLKAGIDTRNAAFNRLRRRRSPTTRTASASTWRATGWSGARCGGGVGHASALSLSVHLVVAANRLQQDGLGFLVLDEAEEDPEIVAGTTGPGPVQLPLQLVSAEPGIEGICPEKLKGGSEILGHGSALLDDSACRPQECGRRQEQPFHEKMSRSISSGV
jgi:hypothetical protein